VFVVLRSADTDDSESSTLYGQTTLPPCGGDQAVFDLADEARAAAGFASAGDGHGPDRRAQAMLDDETVFSSSGSGPELNAHAAAFGSNEDAELNRAIEASLQGQQPPIGGAIKREEGNS
jgi:hypothetical protein